jgi:hypothetical protein
LTFALLLVSRPVQAQVTVQAPGSNPPGRSASPSDANYGPPRVVDIETINFAIDSYQRTQVLVEGEIEVLAQGQYWTIRQGSASLLVLAGHNLNRDTLEKNVGTGARMEIRGVVRRLRAKEYVMGVDLDLIEDPTLPVLPAPAFDQGWPRNSITALAVRERAGSQSGSREITTGGLAAQILDEPSAYSGKTTKILGQFRGRNLFGDLPANSARGKDDWVLKDGDTAVWVMGKAPKGDGWKLDLDYQGDSKSWLEVEGKPEVVNGVVYLKASRVLIAKAPGTERRRAPPR